MLAAIRRHAAVALAAARMAAAMLRLRCLAWLLRTIDCSACGGAQARSYGIGCGWNCSNVWAGADALSFCARSRAVLAAVCRHAVMSSTAARVAAAMFGLAFDALSLCARVRAVLAAVLRHAVVALAAAGIAAAMVGRVLTRSAVVHTQQRCLQQCLGMPRRHWLRPDGSSDDWVGV